ncbi:hypothetical protein ACFXTH_044116 [Malus domestica]
MFVGPTILTKMPSPHDQNCLLALRSAGVVNNPIEYGIRNVNGASVSRIVLNPLKLTFSFGSWCVWSSISRPQTTLLVGEQWFMTGVSLAPPPCTDPLVQP